MTWLSVTSLESLSIQFLEHISDDVAAGRRKHFRKSEFQSRNYVNFSCFYVSHDSTLYMYI